MSRNPLTRYNTLRILTVMTGEEVRRIRKRLGLTQAEFAETVGVATNSVARWERGELGIRESAARLMRLLEKSKPKLRKSGKGR